jgi:hypothetical protein
MMTDNNPNSSDPANNQSLFQQQDQNAGDNKLLELSKEQLANILKQNTHAQSHIKTIEEENKTLRDQIAKMSRDLEMSTQFEDLLEGLANPPKPNTFEQTAPQLDKNALLTELKQDIFNELTKAQAEALLKENMNQSLNYVKSKFGDNYTESLRNVADQLSIDQSYLDDLARTSPKAFQTMVESVSPSKTPFAPTTNSFRTNPTPQDPNADIKRIAALKNQNTPEGRQARQMWNSEDFQRSFRQRILENASKNGSQFGNQI